MKFKLEENSPVFGDFDKVYNNEHELLKDTDNAVIRFFVEHEDMEYIEVGFGDAWYKYSRIR